MDQTTTGDAAVTGQYPGIGSAYGLRPTGPAGHTRVTSMSEPVNGNVGVCRERATMTQP